MYPYFALLSVPCILALIAPRGGRFTLFVVAILYAVAVGLRFHVGMDWNNYLVIFQSKRHAPLAELIFSKEPGYGLLMWVGITTGWGIIFVNAVSGLVFCYGFFSVAKRCREPWLAIAIATPLLVIAFAMSGIRQALAAGIIFYLMAHWEDYRTIKRIILVGLASLFHFSAIFIMMFVALGSKAPNVVRLGGAILVGILVVGLVQWAPDAVEAYARLYVGSQTKISAPGAIVQVLPIAAAAALYLLYRQPWIAENGDSPLYSNMAWTSLLIVPSILLSSVGAYRFALYFWPMAMYVYGGTPALISSAIGRLFCRLCFVIAAFALLLGWILLGNNSYAWLPYQNLLLQPDYVGLFRRPGSI